MTRPPGVLVDDYPTVEYRVSESTQVWARDLTALFQHAKERFGDVCWESEDVVGDQIWGHKAVIYARAPKAFKDRYFASSSFTRSSSSLQSPCPSNHLLPPLFPSRPTSPPSSFRPSPVPGPGRNSSLSATTFGSTNTARPADGILRLIHGDTPELFQAQLEWLYTGEGFGDVVEWISAEDDSGLGVSIRDSLGRRGNLAERQDRLGQDLTYMWRSKLYVDVRIHLDTLLEVESASASASEDSDESTDSLSSTAVFTAHRFILASRSPYFASVLLNPSAFRPSTADIHLPTPPFTPAALHFCLGFIYAGHLDFSNRSFDLLTAFQIHRAAAYLQLDSLTHEIEARIVHDFCHGLSWDQCHCSKCHIRAGRVWRFAGESDVGAVILERRAREYILRGWGETWGREIGSADKKAREGLTKDVIDSITPDTAIAAFRSLDSVRARMESGLRRKGREASVWVDGLQSMIEVVEDHVRSILIHEFTTIAEGKELFAQVSGQGFNGDVLETVTKDLVEGVSTLRGCVEAPRVYQALVSSILLRVDTGGLKSALPIRSRGREQIESCKEGVLAQIRKRWMQIRDDGGFTELEHWALKEISDEIEVSLEDLLAVPTGSTTPVKAAKLAPAKSSLPRTTSSRMGLSDIASTRSTARASVASRSSAFRTRPSSPPEPSGLKRLRLSSSASTSSVTSNRSVLTAPAAISGPVIGPQPRSPTAAKQGSTVSIGAARSRTSGRPGSSSPSPSPRVAPSPRPPMTGPPRQLLTKPTIPTTTVTVTSPGKAPSVKSVRSAKTARLDVTPATLAVAPVRPPNAEAGPSRLHTPAVSTTSSVRSRVAALNKVTPRPPDTRAESLVTGRKTPVVTKKPPIPKLSPATPRKPISPSASTTASLRSRTISGASQGSKAASTVTRTPATGRAVSVPRSQSPAPSAKSTRSTVTATPDTPGRTSSVRPKSPAASVMSTRTRYNSAASRTSTLPKATPPPVPSTRIAPTSTPRSARVPINPPSDTKHLSPPSTAAPRLRTVSAASALSKSTRRPHPPISSMPQPISTRSFRSPSDSTDDASEARTPRLAATLHSDPKIRRDGSDASDHSSPTAKPPPPSVMIVDPRTTRKVGQSSVHSARLHPASAFDPPRRQVIVPLPELEIDDGSIPFSGAGVALRVGVPCIVSLEGKRARFKACIKYLGHMKGRSGAWVGLEVEDLGRFGVTTYPKGSKDGVHYFHLTQPTFPIEDFEIRTARQRRVHLIRENLPLRYKQLVGLGLGTGLAVGDGLGKVGKRSTSPNPNLNSNPFGSDWSGIGGVDIGGRALFVRPSEVVYILGAE